MGDTYRQEALCINKVRYIASQFFHSEFIEFPGRIDNGLDGAIFWREGNKIIDAIYVQCKGGDSYFPKTISEKFTVQGISKEYVTKHIPVWQSVSGPAIMVLCNEQEQSWWIDLKSDSSYDHEKMHIYGYTKNVIDLSAKEPLRQIIRKKYLPKELPSLSIFVPFLTGCLGKESLKSVACSYYHGLREKKLPSKCKELDKKIVFSRVGWRHITRSKRSQSRIVQSFLLLPLIPEIIKQTAEYKVVDRSFMVSQTGKTIIEEKIALLCECKFSYRFPAIVKVVLIRKREFTEKSWDDKVWFYSIYEEKRNQSLKELLFKG